MCKTLLVIHVRGSVLLLKKARLREAAARIARSLCVDMHKCSLTQMSYGRTSLS